MKNVNPTRLAQISLANIAQKMLDGELGFIEGSRQICSQRWSAKIHQFDKDILKFVAIDAETDAFPFGSDACKRLVERFKEK